MLSKLRDWWNNLELEQPACPSLPPPRIEPDPEYPMSRDAIQRLKDKKVVSQQEAFDLLYYDKVDLEEYLALKDRVQQLERHQAYIEHFLKRKFRQEIITEEQGLNGD